MTAEPKVFDPEVEALLREIAADPNSSLLRVTRPQAVKGLFERTERVSPGMTGLSSAERHLVQVHRNEVAHLLREVCRWRMMNDPGSRKDLSPFQGDEKVKAPSVQEFEGAARLLEENEGERPEGSTYSALQLIRRCVIGESLDVHVSSLASASHRLEPNDSARIYMGLDLAFRGRPHSALRLFKAVLAESASPAVRSIAWGNAAMAYELLNSPTAMTECFRESTVSSSNLLSAMEWLHGALRCEHRGDVLRAAAQVDELVGSSPAMVSWYEGTLRERRRDGWTPTRSQADFAHSLSPSLPQHAKRIADVFA